MTEKLLQFIWQFQYFSHTTIDTINQEKLEIVHPGVLNTNQGPDFLNAKIKINNTLWIGHIELHLKTSDWKKHGHEKDKNYNPVILHVVWQHDELVNDCAVFELNNRVSKILLSNYENLMNSRTKIPCQQLIKYVRDITLTQIKNRLLVERLTHKTQAIEIILNNTQNNWEQTFWQLLARSFGMKINANAFESIAKSLPITLLAKHKHQIHQIEALLFGQAGLLQGQYLDSYPKLLQREFVMLQKKYQLQPNHENVFFLRMRPANFPSIRLAQLSALIQQSVHLFSKIKETSNLTSLYGLLNVPANDYWHYHYIFDDLLPFKEKKTGKQLLNHIIINTICPILFAYGKYTGNEIFKERALQWLEQLPAEKNIIITLFDNLNIYSKNAFESQALIELKNNYCNEKKCLQCSIGNDILKHSH